MMKFLKQNKLKNYVENLTTSYNILCLNDKMRKYYSVTTSKLNTYLYRSKDNLMIDIDLLK